MKRTCDQSSEHEVVFLFCLISIPTMPGKCTLKEAWLGNRHFSIWIERGKSSGQARCKVCSKDFDIQNMGEAAVKSHKKSKKHIDAVEGKLINCFSCLFVHF